MCCCGAWFLLWWRGKVGVEVGCLHVWVMNTPRCLICGKVMTRHGKTSTGRQRWRCRACGISQVVTLDTRAKHVEEFLAWLLSRERQADMPGAGRSFRRRTQGLWEVWPLPGVVDEVHHVVFVDGIHLGRRAVVLIARSQDYVLGWYLARMENSRAWAALMSRIAPPDVVVTDGGSGFEKARRKVWPDTVVQRCVFHAFNQIKTGTTGRPRLLAGKELYALGLRLLRLDTSEAAGVWVDDYVAWCVRWGSFLDEKTWIDGQLRLTHERLVRARNGVNRLLDAGVLFSYLDPVLCEAGVVASTNNLIEGGTNAPLRSVLRDHRGMRLMRRVKAIYWWCYMHTENPLPAAQVLKVMPTDAMIQARYDAINEVERHHRSISQFGDAVAWHELHKTGPYRIDWD